MRNRAALALFAACGRLHFDGRFGQNFEGELGDGQSWHAGFVGVT
jgi:hypothetical protein